MYSLIKGVMTNQHASIVRFAAAWNLRRHWLVAVGFALVPVLFTAAGSAIAQIAGADEASSALIIAIGASISAGLGLLVMRLSPPTLGQYGFRAAAVGRSVWWFLPLPISIVIVVATQGVQVTGAVAAPCAVLTIAVAVNEEVWFRGIILAVLRKGGVRVAIIGSSVLFGVLHLANLAGGTDPAAAVLQIVFAALFGVVAAELTIVTGSLWPAIVWHAAWDFANFVGDNAVTSAALIGIGVVCAMMLAYAFVMWTRTRATTVRSKHPADRGHIRS